MVIAPNQPVLSAPVDGLPVGRGGVVGGRGGAVGSAESGSPVVECAAAGVVAIMAGSYHKSRGLVPYVTRLVPCVTSVRTLCYEPLSVVTAVVMTVSDLAEAIGSEQNTRSAAPEVEGRVAEME